MFVMVEAISVAYNDNIAARINQMNTTSCAVTALVMVNGPARMEMVVQILSRFVMGALTAMMDLMNTKMCALHGTVPRKCGNVMTTGSVSLAQQFVMVRSTA